MGIGSLYVAVKKELNPVDVFGSPHQKRAADAKGSSGAPNAQTGVAAMAKRDGMQAAVALQNLTSVLVRFDHETLYALRFFVRLDDAHGQPSVIHDGRDRVVADLSLLRLRHLAVVTGGLGRLATSGQRVTHRLGQDL